MTTFVHANGQTGRLPAGIGSADTSINLGQPWGGAGGTAKLIFDPALAGLSNSNMEIVYATVSNGSPTAAAVLRGQEGTAAVSHAQSSIWACGPTGLDIDGLMTNPMSSTGDLIIGGTAGAPARLGAGSNGQVLAVIAGSPGWQADTGLTNPMTTLGDIIVGGTGGTPLRLGLGSNGQFVGVSGGVIGYFTPAGFANPMTTVGDVIVGGTAGAPTRQALGSNGQFLGVSGGVIGYFTPAGFANPMTTVGDLIVGGTAGAAGRLASGLTGQLLTGNGAGVAPTWQTPASTITITQQSGTTYTLALADAGTEVETTNGSAVTVTIPTNGSVAFPVGTVINIRQAGAGQVTVAAAGGVTLDLANGAKTRVQWSTVTIIQRAANEWVLNGDSST